ncbi:MAG: hypothetical protein KAX49_14715 [Halanaerobiales bacterium]|nr:hypothetical protein [Halanaerobiales bacterium]
MLPSYFIQLDTMPINANGKIDRKALPKPDGKLKTGVEYVAPENTVEETLVEIWSEILQLEKIGTNDNFFDIGGNSMLLIQAFSLINEKYPNKITVPDLFSYSTIKSLAEFIAEGNDTSLKDIKIPMLTMPKEYFINTQTRKKEANIQFKMDKDLLNNLRKIAEHEKVEVIDIILAMYVYLWSDITKAKKLSLQTILDKSVNVNILSMDLKSIANISDLVRLTYSVKNEFKHTNSFKVESVEKLIVKKEKFSVIPLFYAKGTSEKVDLLTLFDIILVANGSQGEFVLKYNSGRFDRNQMVKLVKGYMRLIKILQTNYQ